MSDVKETVVYDNCLNYKETDGRPATLSEFLEIEEEEELDKEWKKHWIGMPEYEQEDNPPYKKLYVSFRTEEDYQEFANIIGQKLTNKTKIIWHPKLNRDENSLKRWIEEEVE